MQNNSAGHKVNGLPPSLDALLRKQRVRVADVGARGGWPRKWREIRPWATLIGFEPEAGEYSRLQRTASEDEIYIGKALYRREGQVCLYHTRDPYCSSLYRPNRELIRRLRPGDVRMDLIRTEPIQATTLDNALESAGLHSVDFIKLDTQGSELDILLGATETLGRGVIGVEIEVEFLPLYENQPLFADVHEVLTGHDFVLMDFPRTCSVSDFRSAVSYPPSRGFGSALSQVAALLKKPLGTGRSRRQLLYADAIYIRDRSQLVDFMEKDGGRPDLFAARAVAVCCANGYYDHALDAIDLGYSRGIIPVELRDDLQRAVASISKSIPHIREDLIRTASRLRDRLRFSYR